jgi:hypothetical protein
MELARGAHLLTLVVRARQDDGYAVMWTEHVPGSTLDIRGEGRLVIDPQATLTSASAREYGVRLGQALFTGATLEGWLQARARGRERLHVVLEIEAPELRTLRWERLCAPFGEAWDFLRCDQRTPFTLRVASQSDRAYERRRGAPRAGRWSRVRATWPTTGSRGVRHAGDADRAARRAAPWPVDVLAFGVPDAVGLPTLEGLCDAADRASLRGGPRGVPRGVREGQRRDGAVPRGRRRDDGAGAGRQVAEAGRAARR